MECFIGLPENQTPRQSCFVREEEGGGSRWPFRCHSSNSNLDCSRRRQLVLFPSEPAAWGRRGLRASARLHGKSATRKVGALLRDLSKEDSRPGDCWSVTARFNPLGRLPLVSIRVVLARMGKRWGRGREGAAPLLLPPRWR